MADFPPPEKVAGPYVPQFEIYWKKLDPENTGKVAPMVAAQFLKLSGLSDQTLGKVWELSDPDGRGYLDKTGVFVACKLVALSQSSKELLTESLMDPSPAPNFGAATAPGAEVAEAPRGTPAPSINFLVKPDEKRKYDTLFDQLKPVSGLLPGDKVRNVMMGSKLPMSMLGKIWDLADQDKDGNLDRYEFTVAMHLVYRALQGDMIPDQLPTELGKDKVPQPLSTNINMAELNVSYNGSIARPTSAVQAVPWVVNAGDRLRYKALFEQTDNDKDGFISGVEIKNVFLQTGLPQNILAHIWNLCDMRQEGKLNPEQFALAMYLVQQKQAGKDPPAQLTPDMVPPSMRPKGEVVTGQAGGSNKSVYQNPELEAMAKEIQELLQEKMALERGVQEQEYIISAKSTETHSLQAEFDTLNSTLTQLTNQKNIAQKRLDDLDGQKASMGTDLQELDSRISEEEKKVKSCRNLFLNLFVGWLYLFLDRL
jgi:epidermal growth factor receptor substrate 15